VLKEKKSRNSMAEHKEERIIREIKEREIRRRSI
jgi:hypothetical protein